MLEEAPSFNNDFYLKLYRRGGDITPHQSWGEEPEGRVVMSPFAAPAGGTTTDKSAVSSPAMVMGRLPGAVKQKDEHAKRLAFLEGRTPQNDLHLQQS